MTTALEPARRPAPGAVAALGSAWLDTTAAVRVGAVVGGGAVVVGVGLWAGPASPPVLVAVTVALLALVAAAVVDVVERRLPNGFVLVAAAAVTGATATTLLTGHPGPATGAALGTVMVGAPMLLTHLVSPAGLGFGDVKASTALGGALGLLGPVIAVGALLVALVAAASLALVHRCRHVAFGPPLVVGAVVAVVGARIAGLAAW